MSSDEWLESLKAGDEVAINSRYGYSIEKVTKVTKTQIVTQQGRYRKDTGSLVGSSIWNTASIEPVTDVIRKKREKSIIRAFMREQNFSELSLDQLERIKSIIDEGKQ